MPQCRKRWPAYSLAALMYLCLVPKARAQKHFSTYDNAAGTQIGYGIKLSIDYSKLERFNFRLGLSAGVGSSLGNDWLYPSAHADLMIYSGGFGSNRPGVVKFANSIGIDFIFSYTLTVGTGYRMLENGKYRPGERNYPLYYFQNYTLPPLQNPYRWSVSGGGNYVLFLTRKLYNRQAVGFLNLHADRLQFSYINDGPPFIPPLGDRKDRYFTGGGLITYHLNDDAPFNLLEASFGKFTGYSPSAYELSNKLGHSYILYKNMEENYYNKSSLTFSASNTARGYGMYAILYNYPRTDFQHTIHDNMYYSLHLVPYKGSTAGGITGYYQQSKIGLKK